MANVQTESYLAQRAISGENASNGVENVEVQISTAPSDPNASNVDLTYEVTNQILDANTYESNAKIVKAQNDTLGTLLDILE